MYDGKIYILYFVNINGDNFLDRAYSKISGYDISSGANFLNITDEYVYGSKLYVI